MGLTRSWRLDGRAGEVGLGEGLGVVGEGAGGRRRGRWAGNVRWGGRLMKK